MTALLAAQPSVQDTTCNTIDSSIIADRLAERLANPSTPATDLPAIADARNKIIFGDIALSLAPGVGSVLAEAHAMLNEQRHLARLHRDAEVAELEDRRLFREQRRAADERVAKAAKEIKKLKKELADALAQCKKEG